MNAKSPVSAAVVMLVVAVFILGGLTGYAAGTHQVAVAAAPAPGMVPAGMCPMSAKGNEKAPAAAVAGKTPAEAATCPMSGKAKSDAACVMGGKKGECSEHPGCPDAGKCAVPAAKGAAAMPKTCPMGGDKTATAAGKTCPMGGSASSAKADTDKADGAKAVYVCPMCPGVKSDSAAKCPKCGMDLVKK